MENAHWVQYNQVKASLYQQMGESGEDKARTQRTEEGMGSEDIFTREYCLCC